jgi:hypothetical protein
MKRAKHLKEILFLLLMTGTIAQAQSTGDYKTKASGLWSDVSIWQIWDGLSWIDASVLPDASLEFVHISIGDSVSIDHALVLDKVVIDDGGILTLSNMMIPFTDTLHNASDSKLEVNGKLYIGSGATLKGAGTLLNNASGYISLDNGGTVAAPLINNGTLEIGSLATLRNSIFINNNTMILDDNSVLNVTNATLINNDSISVLGESYVTGGNTGIFNNNSGAEIYKADINATLQITQMVTFANYGILKGQGTYDLPSSNINTGIVSPGNSAGKLSITPNAVNGRSPTFDMQITGSGAAPGTTYDQVTFTPDIPLITDLSSSSLVVNDMGNTDPVGTVYAIMVAPFLFTGNFTDVSIPSNYSLHYNLNTVTLIKESPLTVAWGSFTAIARNNQAYLQWSILQGKNVAYFTVEYSSDGFQYVTLDTIAAQNPNTAVTPYSYYHPLPSTAVNYYRIKMTEEDKAQSYSPTVSLRINSAAVQIAPNPVEDMVFLFLSTDKASMRIVNAQGEEIKRIQVYEGMNTMFLGDLTPGVYQLFIQEDNSEPDMTKIVKL